MTCRLRLLTARLLLAVMLLTFLSPNFGWQVVAGHELLGHPAAEVADHDPHHDAGTRDDHVPHGHGGEHDEHERAASHGHDHEDAHSMIGHVLSHMPATTLSSALPAALPHQPVLRGAEPSLAIPSFPPDQPYRPPQLPLV